MRELTGNKSVGAGAVRYALCLWVALALAACQSIAPPVPAAPPQAEQGVVVRSVYFIGDAGEPDGLDKAPPEGPVGQVLTALADDVRDRCAAIGADHTSVVILGDNVYPYGLAPANDPDRARGERILDATVAAAGPARAYVLMGNHDWGKGRRDKLANVAEQGRYLASLPGDLSVVPPVGCRGPVSADIGDRLRLVFADPAAWWLRDRVPDSLRCPSDTTDFFDVLGAEFAGAGDRFVVYATHYPFVSTGPHGGTFGWTEHLFPMRDASPNLWIPVPIFGSMYVFARQLWPTAGDVGYPAYRDYRESVESKFTSDGAPQLVIAGHEHGLQLHHTGGRFYAVSGAGSARKLTRTKDSDITLLALSKPGYMRLDIMDSGWVRLVVTSLDDEGARHQAMETWLGRVGKSVN